MIAATCCATAVIVAIVDASTLQYVHFQPRHAPTMVCISCGTIDVAGGFQLTPHSLAKLRAHHILAAGSAGTAATLGLPPLTAIAPYAKTRIITTNREGRIELDNLDSVRKSEALRADLRVRLIDRMRLRLEYPRVIKETVGLGHPAIMHIGLAHKFTSLQDLDTGHIRFARYIPHVLQIPMEIWKDYDTNRDVFRIIGALLTGTTNVHFMHVLVEAESHILTTAYTVDAPARIEQYRSGTPQQLYWA